MSSLIPGVSAQKKAAQAQQVQFQNQMAAAQRQQEATRKQMEMQKAMQAQQQVGRQMRRRDGSARTQTILTPLGSAGGAGDNNLLGI